MVCTFFGHRDAPESVETVLRTKLVELIEWKNADTFLVGNQGAFDRMVIRQLKALRVQYPHIHCAVVLAYMPEGNEKTEELETVFPDRMEYVPRRFAVDRRNRWMLEKADCVLTYVVHSVGGAAKYKRVAEQKGKMVVELAK